MHLIRVLFNFCADFRHSRQIRRECREWLLVAQKYALYKDLRQLIDQKYIQRKRIVHGDSYKTIICTILIVCLVCYVFACGLVYVQNEILFNYRAHRKPGLDGVVVHLIRYLMEIILQSLEILKAFVDMFVVHPLVLRESVS